MRTLAGAGVSPRRLLPGLRVQPLSLRHCHPERSEGSLATAIVTLNEVKGLLREPEDSSPETGSE